MNLHRWAIALLIVFVGAVPACRPAHRIPEATLAALAGADRVEFISENRVLRTIVDRRRIRQTARALRAISEGWQSPWPSGPIPGVVLRFHREDELLLEVGVGRDCLTTGTGHHWSLPFSETDRVALFSALGLREKGPTLSVAPSSGESRPR